MFKFIKIGPYSPTKNNLSKFESVKLLTQNKYNPPLDKDLIKDFQLDRESLAKIDFVLFSSLGRSTQSFEYLKNNYLNTEVKYRKTDLLKEIHFDISQDCTKESYEKEGSNEVRRIFIKQFINNNLLEKREQLIGRINLLNTELEELSKEYKNILCLSHTFFIKIYQIQNLNKYFLGNNPKLINKFIKQEKKIMEFFEISNSNKIL
ncbi:MAG: histidine phosphatase family protein [Patescibacteria group bacterium]|jgi:hypothetical protein|nr:histidine phosphatase family protein [Patescibacteria group bacterium]